MKHPSMGTSIATDKPYMGRLKALKLATGRAALPDQAHIRAIATEVIE
jgi:hypothetical protein